MVDACDGNRYRRSGGGLVQLIRTPSPVHRVAEVGRTGLVWRVGYGNFKPVFLQAGD